MRLFLIVFFLAFLAGGAASAADLPVNQRPMFGNVEKSESMKKADADFIASIEKQGLSRKEASHQIAQLGWRYFFQQRDPVSAMARFNQAWLLNPENGDAYHGFAVISAERREPAAETEKLFKLAISKQHVQLTAYSDYARFLNMNGRFEDVKSVAKAALAISPDARDAKAQLSYAFANMKDFPQACHWAEAAKKNGDTVEEGYIKEICKRAGK